MKWKTLSAEQAKSLVSQWNGVFDVQLSDELLVALRKELIGAAHEIYDKLGLVQGKRIDNHQYKFDLEYGISIYRILNEKYNFNATLASDDLIWRHLSVCVVPDLVYLRHGNNEERIWKRSNRIWLKSLWWYIYLSWQGNYEDTYEVLQMNSTDYIMHLVERSGEYGYRVELCRSIIKYNNKIRKENNVPQDTFKKVMKLSTARIKVVEPSLMDGGEEAYVKELFEYFGA